MAGWGQAVGRRLLIALVVVGAVAVMSACMRREIEIFESPLPVYLPVVMHQRIAPSPRKGVGCITQMDYSCADVIASRVGWMHDWSMRPRDCGIPVVCQAWGLGSELQDPDPRCEIVLLWNEPSVAGQANISPQVTADRWGPVEVRRTTWGKEISTPCDTTLWLTTWANAFKAANGRWPTFDWVCIHSYPAAYTAQQAIDATMAVVNGAKSWSLAHGGDGRVILHEFGVWPVWGEGITQAYIEGVVPLLEESGIMYAWFALSDVGKYMTKDSPYAPYYDTSLVKDGQLTQLGTLYLQ